MLMLLIIGLKSMKHWRMTMNKHIELVKKWLADPDSVTLEELEKNRDDAWAAAAGSIATAYASAAAYAAAAAAAYAADTVYWVKRYDALEEEDE
jgi:hypothetical protein